MTEKSILTEKSIIVIGAGIAESESSILSKSLWLSEEKR